MPGSEKILKNRAQAANRAAGIGDASGKLPARVKAAEVNAACTQCQQPIRMTKTNTEAKQHAEAKHPGFTFAVCFPGQFDPTVVVVETAPAPSAQSSTGGGSGGGNKDGGKKGKGKKEDLSFLDASLPSSGGGKGKGKK